MYIILKKIMCRGDIRLSIYVFSVSKSTCTNWPSERVLANGDDANACDGGDCGLFRLFVISCYYQVIAAGDDATPTGIAASATTAVAVAADAAAACSAGAVGVAGAVAVATVYCNCFVTCPR